MNKRTWTLVGAGAMALLAAAVVWLYVASIKDQTKVSDEVTTVLVATADIPGRTSGETVVEKSLVERKQMPKGVAAVGAVTDEAQLQGKVLVSALAKGQQVVTSQLTTLEAQSLAWQIKPGMRAVSIAIDRVSAVGGTIRTGDRVDVISTFPSNVINEAKIDLDALLPDAEEKRIVDATGVDPAASKSSLTRVILQQVEVLRIDPVDSQTASAISAEAEDKKSDEEAPNSPVATLMVSAHDAERLVFAQELGKISLLLVPAEDRAPVQTPGAVLISEFLWTPPAAVPGAATVNTSN